MTTERSLPIRAGEWARQHPRIVAGAVMVTALALIGTAIILASTIFAGVPGIGQAEPTPSPSSSAAAPTATAEPSTAAAPSESAAPKPPPGPQWPPVADPAAVHLLPPMWAVSMVDDLNVRSGPGTENPAIGQLDAGDVALVIDVVDGEWVWVAVDGAIGYVNAGPVDDRYLLGTKTPWVPFFTSVVGVATDGDSYFAYGSHFEADYPPYEVHGVPSLALRSDDGITWTDVDSGLGLSIKAAAGSDTGWVAIGSIPLSGGSLMSFSPDGVTWDEPTVVGDGVQHAVAHGPAGWLAIDGDAAWASADGRSWSEPSALDLENGGSRLELESSDGGYVVFDRYNSPAIISASADGVGWTAIDLGASRVSDIELVGDKLLVVLVDEDGVTTVRRGTLDAGGAVTWDAPAADIGGEGFHVDRITQSPDSVLAVGWDEEHLVPALWLSTNGATWTRLAAEQGPDGVGLFEPVWGAAGWVGPGLIRSVDGEDWLSSDHSLAYDGPVPPCPPAEKVSLIVLAYLGRFAEGCFGDTSLTIRGFIPVGEGFGGCCPAQGEPGWLAGSFPGTILAAGAVEEFGSSQLIVRIPPGIDVPTPGGWVEIVGHYSDPASADCVSRPQKNFPNPLASHESMQALCRERFVVESVMEVQGP